MAQKVPEPTYKKYIVDDVPRFDEANHIYSRVDRGDVISPDEIPAGDSSKSAVHRIFSFDPERKDRPGYDQESYALRWAGRTIDYVTRKNLYGRENQLNPHRMEVKDPYRMAEQIKKIAKWFGADLVGIAQLNRQWVYSRLGDHSHQLGLGGEVGDPIELPQYYKYVVVIASAMDYEHVKRSPAVEASTDLGYSQMAFIASSLARYIQELGYHAMPSGNDTALSIPMAIDAGLGELGRNGQLITEKYGPRVRLSKVFTELPLAVDQPVDLGVQHICEKCEKCAKTCPGQAIPYGERTFEPNSISNNRNLLKWPVNAERCIGWWLKNRAHCTNCVRSCTFNKPDTYWHRAAVKIISKTEAMDRFLLWLDDFLGFGKQEIK